MLGASVRALGEKRELEFYSLKDGTEMLPGINKHVSKNITKPIFTLSLPCFIDEMICSSKYTILVCIFAIYMSWLMPPTKEMEEI